MAKLLFTILVLAVCLWGEARAEGNVGKHKAVPYILCGLEKMPLRGADTLYTIKALIAPFADDLSSITNTQLVATSYAALCNIEDDPNAIFVSVWMFERCGGSVLLSRAQVGEGTRKAWGSRKQSHGPREELVRVSEAIGKVKKGAGIVTARDYAKVGKFLKISGEQAKALHMELTGYMGTDDFYDDVRGTGAEQPARVR